MLDGIPITTKKSMKVLGVIFDTKLTWYEHISKTIVSANKVKQGLAIISKYFCVEEMLKLATANFYSRLYYAAKVWLISTIAAPLKKKLWQVSSRMLKIVKRTGGEFTPTKNYTRYARELLHKCGMTM